MKSKRTKGARVKTSQQNKAANPLALAIQTALKHHQAGEFQEAETFYRKALKLRPNYPDALHLLGFLYHSRDQNEDAVKWIKKAVAFAPKQPLYYSNLGTVFSAMGKIDESIACYEKALAIDPNYVNAICNLGNAMKEQGKLEEAIAWHQKALAIQPDFHEVHNNLGIALQGMGKKEEAIASYRRALELKSDYDVSYNNLGYALQETGEIEEAITCYKKAIELRPAYPEAYNNMGNAFLAQGKHDEARTCYQNSLALMPDYQDAIHNMGNLFRDQGKLDDAIECYKRALEISPNLYDAYNNMGNAYQKKGDKQEAINCYRTALTIRPNAHGAYSNMGFALQSIGEMEEAIACYKKAMEFNPNNPNTHSTLLHQMQWLCDWEDYQARYEQMMDLFNSTQKPVNPFTLILFPTTAEEQRRCAESYVKEKYPARGNMCASRSYAPNPERLKIGYLSSDFHNHATSLLMAELFELHDHDRFEIKAYSHGEDDGQDMRRRIVAACDTFTDICALSHQEAAQQILADGVHILIEMKGFTNNTRLEIPGLRPAPIQASWLGYPGTSGAPFIDYILTDHFITPPGFEAHFTEKIVRLPGCYQPNDQQRTISARQHTREEYGLPKTGFIFASFNKSYKINPELFDCWMRLLQGTPGSILWLWEANNSVIKNIHREALARGVDSSRIHFAGYQPFADHLARYRLVDLALDPFPCTSHTTGSDALWGGCPMVTCAGETFASRVAGSLLVNCDLPELITYTPEEYETLILELANDADRLASIRQKLQDNLATAPLFDSKRYTMGMEAAFEAMWQRFQSGLQPNHIDLQPVDPNDSAYIDRKFTVKTVQHAEESTPADAIILDQDIDPQDRAIALQVQEALQIHQEGRMDEAEAIYRQVLELRPDHPEALHLFGFLFHQRGQNEIAAEWIGKAIVADSNQPLFLSNLGIVLAAMGKRQEAIDCYQKALDIQPDFYNAICNMGNALLDQGERTEGIACYRKALELHPGLHAGHNNLGNALQGDKQYEEAIASYERALVIKPEYLEALNNMAFAYQALEKFEDAIACCNKALSINPNYHDAYSNIGNALLAQGKADEAIASYRKALEVKPDYRDAYNNLGNALLGQGKLEEAVSCYQKALEIAPDLYDAYNNLGNALQELGRLDEAVASYRKAIELKPDYCGALNNLGFALLDQNELEEAISCYQQALDLSPDDPNKHSAVLHQMLHICDWKDFQGRYERMIKLFNAEQQNVIPFVFLSLPTTPAEQRKCAELYIKDRVPPSIHGRLSDTRHYDPNPERIKVGYLSGDYQNHPVAYLMAELFDLHDRSRFEITAYSYGEDDGRDMRRRIMATSDHFVDLRPLTYEAAAQRIFDDGTHIIIEMNGFTKGVRLQIPALHPAPIQTFWLGYAGTIGAPFIDYLLTDSFVSPAGCEAGFSEKLVRLPDCFMTNDSKRIAHERTPSRQECGLPEEGIIFVNFNKTYKINAAIFDIWMRVLREIPGSVLWMRTYNHWATKNLCREAEARGVDASRLIFAPLTATVNEHLARYHLADLAIDCFPYTSHSTGVDTLWAGCPLVTYVGEPFATRVAGSMLTNINMPELVTYSLEEYEKLILELAKDPERLAAVRQKLQENIATAPLFDSVRFTMSMEAAYEAMWQQFKSGMQPDHINVSAINTEENPYQERKVAAELSQKEPAVVYPGAEKAVDATLQQAVVVPGNPVVVDTTPYQGELTSELFASSLERAIKKELEVVDLIDIAGKLNSDANTVALTAELYRIWLAHNSNNPLAYAIYFNYGSILSAENKLEAAKTVLYEAVKINAEFFPAYINLGSVLERLGTVDAAIACWQQVIDRLPTIKSDLLGYKLSAFKQIGRASTSPEMIEKVLRQSLEIKPDQRDILQQWINVRRGQCKWPLIEPWGDLSKTHLKKGFAPLSLSAYSDDPLYQLANSCMYNKYEYGQPTIDFWDNHQALLANHSSDRIKIGYLSSDIREHAVGYLTAEIYGLHNRERVEIFVYYVGHAVSDHIYTRAKKTSDHWFDATGVADLELAQKIVADKIEILVDLNGHSQGARPKMLAMRPAPIIVNWLGFPGTMGSPYHNYLIADDFIIPQGFEIYYSEKIVRLPCYQPNDRKRRLSDKVPSRQEEGLPVDGMVYSCLNGVQKITPYAWNLWMRILHQVPDSVLWLLSETDLIKGRLREMATQHGVDPERLIFAGRKPNFDHVPRFGLSDLGLDSMPYGSHTTASDGLWAGVPILTLPGISFASRVCGSLVTAAGLGDLVCSSAEEYVERAVDFGKNREKLQKYRQILVTQRDSCVLFDTPSLVVHLEGLYEQMWADFKQGNLPRPDLANLEIYQEIGIELDDDGIGRATDAEYRALYLEKLRQKDRFCLIRGDCRLWSGES